jgi:NADH-quinone oxidoreductase subunit G
MSDMVTLYIDDKAVQAKKGTTILNVARENGMYIPTMCYITKTTPIASCRLCVVEVEGTDGYVLSCQTPAVEGIKVKTNSQELYKYRQNIMKLYAVNHPLECGVCDKSGECDLQNKMLEFGVKEQTFSAKEHKRDVKNWGLISYDESLCILCEKCVSVCNEVTGDDSLEVHFGGYNSHIKRKGDSSCSECGECMAVCPVGALASTNFKYSSNAWELKKVPASCSGCSSACNLFYEVKQTSSLALGEKSIYRVTNSYEFDSLCSVGRFGFDFQNRATKDDEAFNKAIEAFKEAKSIKFNSYITNEEAMILQKLKEKFGYKLINSDAKAYQTFLDEYSKVTAKSLYSATLSDVKKSDFAIVLGSAVANDNPKVKYALNSASKNNKAEVVYMHPIEDDNIKNIVTSFIRYEVGTEEGVLAVLADLFVNKDSLDSDLSEYFEEFDSGYVTNESNISELDIENLQKKVHRKKSKVLVIGSDLYGHTNSKVLAKYVAILEKYAGFKVLIIPSQTNTLGVSKICELDSEAEGFTVGYNLSGDFVLSSFGEGDMNIPALNQQEGTFVSIDKRVVPTNVAVAFDGYCLNDISSSLGLDAKYTIDYTSKLPIDKGFKNIEFDDLSNFIDSMEDTRGYSLECKDVETEDFTLEEIDDLPEFNGSVIYNCNSSSHNDYASMSVSQIDKSAVLIGSNQFAIASKIKDGDLVEFKLGDLLITRVFRINPDFKGTIAINPTFDLRLSNDLIFSTYRYKQVKINKNGAING